LPHVPASESFATRPRFCIPHDHRVLCALCFHGLTNCFCRNSFRFTSIQIAGGGGGQAGKPSAEFVQWTLTSVHSSTYKLLSFRKRVTRSFSVKSKLVGQSAGVGCPHGSPMFRISLLPRRQNRSTAWQVAAYPAGCHNSPLHTKHLAARVCLARQLSPLLLGVTHGCTR
jgi:hypothetical protein